MRVTFRVDGLYDGVDTVTAAARRRQRRLRAYLRYARMCVAMALAESTHHTSRGQRFARAGEEGREEHDALRQRPPPPQPELFQLFEEEEPGGSRPPCLVAPRGPHEKVQQCAVEQLADVVPMVLRMLDLPVIEQVIAAPKISFERVPQRSALPVPQTAEQLVEVPTQPWYVAIVLASKVYSRREIRRIIAGLEGRGGVVLVEVFKVLVLDRIQQRLWSRSLTFQLAEVFQVFSWTRVPQLPHRVVCVTMQMRILHAFFALFPVLKKVPSWVRTCGRNCSPSRAHPRGELMRIGMLQGDDFGSRGLASLGPFLVPLLVPRAGKRYWEHGVRSLASLDPSWVPFRGVRTTDHG